jgi:prepilin-type N-terminal cleavage/methylation domain-containing protein/prepilin-type processing-associated H-X9-DG protein
MKLGPNLHDSPPIRRQGFTLIELLIVIMIIAVMALFTVFITSTLKDKAYQTSALNSMRQVASANVSYSMDNNGDINVLLGAGDSRGAAPIVSNSFWGRLIPYLFTGLEITEDATLKQGLKLRLDALFGTPDSTTMAKTFQKGAEIHKDQSDLPVPFAFNTNVYKPNEYVKTHSFNDPGQTLYMSYGFEYFDEVDGASYAPIPRSGQARSNNIDWFSNKTAAFLFLDGHVEVLSPPLPDRRFKDPVTTP